MTIDKSWTRIRNRSSSSEFFTGLNAFIERCRDHLNDQNRCRCPCQKCDNHEWGTLVDIGNHILRWGFNTAYKTWRFHGEQYDLPVIHDTSQTTDEMVDVLNDVGWENTGNEHEANIDERSNEPTEGSSGANDDIDALHMEVETELYPGCTWLSSLNFLAKMMHMKVMNKWTDSSFDQLLEFLRFAFPKNNKVPSSNYEAKKTMKKLGLGYESIHACKNDCCLFWKENDDMQSCPICGECRWKDKNSMGKKVAQKVLKYFPLTPRLKRMYNSRHTAKSMTWHATGRSSEVGKMRHPVDGKAWKDFDERYPDFARETRNVRLSSGCANEI